MLPGNVICPRCGWSNEPGARMCGGCGQPLATRAAPPPGFDQTPTDPEMAAVARRRAPPYLPPNYVPSSASAPRREQRPAKRSGCGPGCLATLVVIVALVIGSWAFIVRPILHSVADTAVRTALDNIIGLTPVVPAQVSPTVQIDESQAEGLFSTPLFGILPVQVTGVAFRDGREGVTYTSFLGDGTISTRLVTNDGKLSATDTDVQGPLGWIESGAEMQSTLNESLGGIPDEDFLSGLSAKNGTLTVTVKHR